MKGDRSSLVAVFGQRSSADPIWVIAVLSKLNGNYGFIYKDLFSAYFKCLAVWVSESNSGQISYII